MMKAKEFFEKLKEKRKNGSMNKLLTSKAFLVSSCVFLIAVAVGISAWVGHPGTAVGSDDETGKILGNTVLVGGTVSEPDATDVMTEPKDLLALTVLNRASVREDAMATLKQIAENPDALPNEKQEALSQIRAIMKDMASEANIETLALAKGIPECVAVISGEQCSVIVDASGLTEAQCARIVEIVYEQAGIAPTSIRVIPAKSEE